MRAGRSRVHGRINVETRTGQQNQITLGLGLGRSVGCQERLQSGIVVDHHVYAVVGEGWQLGGSITPLTDTIVERWLHPAVPAASSEFFMMRDRLGIEHVEAGGGARHVHSLPIVEHRCRMQPILLVVLKIARAAGESSCYC